MMNATPRFRNFLIHDFLIDSERSKPWTRQDLREVAHGAFAGDSFIFVLSPAHQWVFVDKPKEFGPSEFCDWTELVFGASIIDRAAWPNLELAAEPPADWQALALQMPCRSGPALWDKLSRTELRQYVEGGDLPDDVADRGKPDDLH